MYVGSRQTVTASALCILLCTGCFNPFGSGALSPTFVPTLAEVNDPGDTGASQDQGGDTDNGLGEEEIPPPPPPAASSPALFAISGPDSILSHQCYPFTVATLDETGSAAALNEAVTLNFSTNGDIRFFGNFEDCRLLTAQLTAVDLSVSISEYVVYARGESAGTTTVEAFRLDETRGQKEFTVVDSFTRAGNLTGQGYTIKKDPLRSEHFYIGGSFSAFRSNTANGIARIDSSARLDGSFDVGMGFGSFGDSTKTVSAIEPVHSADPGLAGDIYVGGDFERFQGSVAMHIVRLNGDGSLDPEFAASNGAIGYEGFDNNVYGLMADGDGGVFVVGGFTYFKGLPAPKIAHLDRYGELVPSATSNFGAGFTGGSAAAITRIDATDFVASGDFSHYNGTASDGIVRLNSAGSVVHAAGVGFNGIVWDVLPVPATGDLYAVGFFTTYNGSSANRIIRLNGDLSRDAAFVPIGGGFSAAARTLAFATDSGSDIMVTSNSTNYGGTPIDNIVRLTETGALVTSFTSQYSGFGVTQQMIQMGGFIYSIGFTQIAPPILAGGLAKISVDGDFH